MIVRNRFGEKEWQNTLVYHLNGLEEAANALRQHIRTLDLVWAKDDEETEKALVGIFVELFQLQYHKKEVRRPFARLHNNFYASQEKKGTGKGDRLKRATKKSPKTKAARKLQPKPRSKP